MGGQKLTVVCPPNVKSPAGNSRPLRLERWALSREPRTFFNFIIFEKDRL